MNRELSLEVQNLNVYDVAGDPCATDIRNNWKQKRRDDFSPEGDRVFVDHGLFKNNSKRIICSLEHRPSLYTGLLLTVS